MAQRSILRFRVFFGVFSCVFSGPAPTESPVSSHASNEETLGTAEKTIKPPAIKRQKIKEDNNACRKDFAWHRHEDDVDIGKSGVSA